MEHLRLRQGEARKQKKASVVPQPRPRDHVHLGQQPTWREAETSQACRQGKLGGTIVDSRDRI